MKNIKLIILLLVISINSQSETITVYTCNEIGCLDNAKFRIIHSNAETDIEAPLGPTKQTTIDLGHQGLSEDKESIEITVALFQGGVKIISRSIMVERNYPLLFKLAKVEEGAAELFDWSISTLY
jgi:hypothetical protein